MLFGDYHIHYRKIQTYFLKKKNVQGLEKVKLLPILEDTESHEHIELFQLIE